MEDVPGPNDEQAAYWEDRSSGWIEAEGWWHSAVISGFGLAAIGRLDPHPGQTLLDIGSGTGPTTVELARRVGPDGSVEGLDISPTMVRAARARAADAGVDNATFLVADVQSAELAGRDADGALSRFGVMFFADPVVAFRNVRTGLRAGGRLVFACWQELTANEWMWVPGAASVAVTGEVPSMPGPGEPGPFSLADADFVREVLASAGFSDIGVEDVRREIVVPEDRIDDVVAGSAGLGAVRNQIVARPDLTDRIVDAVRDELRGRLHDGEVHLAAAAWIVSATA